MSHAAIGNYVVYIRNGKLSDLGTNVKDIWKVIDYISDFNVFKLKSMSKDKDFDTSQNNVVWVKDLIEQDMFKKEYFVDKAFNKVRGAIGIRDMNMRNSMNNKKDLVKTTVDANVSALKGAAAITAGRTANSVVSKKITPMLPIMVRGYADTPVGRVVIANLVSAGVTQFAANNTKAKILADAMMQAAMLEFTDQFDIEGIINDLVDQVSIDSLVEKED